MDLLYHARKLCAFRGISELTLCQETALDMLSDWLDDTRQIFYMGGYAGTGKTTITGLVGELLEDSGLDVAYMAPTNKAALVLSGKLRRHVTTPDKLLKEHTATIQYSYEYNGTTYYPGDEDYSIAKHNGGLGIEISPSFEARDAELSIQFAIVDEVSMLSLDNLDRLRRTGAKIILVGDPGQLPTINCAPIDVSPNFILSEVKRTEGESGILALATATREGTPFDVNEYSEVEFLTKRTSNIGSWDAILAYTNATVFQINRILRKGDGVLMPGDKITPLTNDRSQGVAKGMILSVTYATDSYLEATYDGEVYRLIYSDELIRKHCEESFNHSVKSAMRSPQWRKGVIVITYAYAITVHKSQGSEWDSVLVVPDYKKSWFKDGGDRELLYTAFTRASKRLGVVWSSKKQYLHKDTACKN